ncbi:MAG: hypothetical protein KDA60_14445 [Planctomycetales bacterium]|nr:hypothetical protein [Planctomycetales bacterium]
MVQPRKHFGFPGGAGIVLSLMWLVRATASVQFDASPSVACTPAEADERRVLISSHEKLIEARVQISSLVSSGKFAEIQGLFYQFASPERNLQIVDYLPKTTMGTDFGGNIAIEQVDEQTGQIGLGATLGFPQPAQPNVNVSRGTRTQSAVRYELLPPRELLAAAGTTGRGTGAYFKLRPSQQIALEGSREFVLIMQVPKDWRGDYLRLVCTAYGEPRNGQMTTLGQAAFLIPLYAAGDEEARQLADDLSRAERNFLHVVRQQAHEVARRSQPTLVHELSLVGRVIPEDWISRLVYQPLSAAEPPAFVRHLPPVVREAASDYDSAKRQLHDLAGTYLATTGVAAEQL